MMDLIGDNSQCAMMLVSVLVVKNLGEASWEC
jgi:hypothetical protein